ncbi:ATP-grasp domain-containing protein [Paractinoplanes rishiriensis]|uniref:ATP-grasp domain-containing protein n=1 Tax=Paractinoplanes rishiriensis TaxID=1050105 RepID=A0A919K783_9ACTN|nr:ATP-grasp domain-containing protein [Actinoplanes rishiriensis]GIF01354.1 hypothetical protein Ari01nite_88180 [Actinoplanes rishiriensis]
MTKKILMVGLHQGYADMFREADDLALYVLEEEDLYQRDPEAYAQVHDDGLLLTQYQQSDAYRDAAVAWHRQVGFDAVVPAWEYGVDAAWTLAELLGLRSPGRKATQACTDKLQLRRQLDDTCIRQPRWAQVSNVEEVMSFYRGGAIVIKPANRHASVGVVRIDHAAQIPDAWRRCTTAGESRTAANRDRQVEYMAEDFLAGQQISVENLVRNREVVFDNVTLMATAGGPYFPILAVTVPAPLPPAEYTAAIAASHQLVKTLEVADGMIHSEWKIVDGVPFLIESAARVPGAFTAELAARSYDGFNMYAAQSRSLAGLDPAVPNGASSIATARWFHPPSGRVVAIHGVEVLATDPAVFLHRIKVAPGDEIPVCTDGWHRVGYFATHQRTPAELEATVARLLDAVAFEVEPATQTMCIPAS